MPLTKATPEVIDVDKLTLNLKSNTLQDGIRDYVDDTVTSAITALEGLITAEAGTRGTADTATYDLGLANGIDVKLAETNSTTADLNILGTTHVYWVANTNNNRPEITPGVFLENFVLDVICINPNESIQFAKNMHYYAVRYGSGGTAYTNHTWWSAWSIFENTTRLTQELLDRAAGDTDLQDQITTYTDGLAQELLDRAAGDTGLQGQITTLTSGLAQEIDTRVSSDTGLQTTITTLSTAMATIFGLFSQEVTDRAGGDTGLQGQITTVTAGLAQELLDRAAGDNGLDTRVTTVTSGLEQELLDRASGDNGLDARVTTLENANSLNDYTYVNEQVVSSGSVNIDIQPHKGCRFFLLGAGGGGGHRGGGASGTTDGYGATGGSTKISVGATDVIIAHGGGGGANGAYLTYGAKGAKGLVSIYRNQSRYIAIINENRKFSPPHIADTLGMGGPDFNNTNPNQYTGGYGGEGAFCDGMFYNTTTSVITITVSIGTGGANFASSYSSTTTPGTNGCAVIYT